MRTLLPSLFSLLLAAVLLQAPAARADLVTRNGTDFWYRNGKYQYVGVNIDGLAFMDEAEQREQLTSASQMGVKVVRVFIARRGLTNDAIRTALGNLLNVARSINPELKFILALTNFYWADNDYQVAGDEGYYDAQYLKPEWFTTRRYDANYKALVTVLVDAFKADDRIFAWELGNELQMRSGDANALLTFAYDMGWYIRNRGALQMVTTGFISARHAVANAIADKNAGVGYVYSSWNGRTSPFHFVTIHGYNNNWTPPANGNPLGEYEVSDYDYRWAKDRMPWVMEEFGFTGSFKSSCWQGAFRGGNWDGIWIPDALSSRESATRAVVDRFFSNWSMDGIMHWAFMAGGDNGRGDRCFGLDDAFHYDWSALRGYYAAKASSLPAGGSGTPPPASARLYISNPGAGIWTGLWVTHCLGNGTQRVWQVSSDVRWADYRGIEPQKDCGTAGTLGMYPLVFRDSTVASGTWVTWCTGSNQDQWVWQSNGGWKFVPFMWPEKSANCP